MAATFALFALVVAVISAGQRYFYCPTMNQSAFAACCEHGDAAQARADIADGPAIGEHADCCQARSLEGNAPYSPYREAPSLFAPLVAILPALFALDPVAVVEQPWASLSAIRAGPSAGEARASLQVYLC